MLIDTRRTSFDMRQIQNRRFMYQPQTGELILGYQYKGSRLVSSHAEEHFDSGAKAPFDSFIRGWIGTGKGYKNGIIHFAPDIPAQNTEAFDKGFSTLQMFSENNANGDTVIRGFGGVWEQPLNNLITERSDRMNEQFSILIDSRSRMETGEQGGVWLAMPATAEQLQDAMRSVGVTADNPQDFVINDISMQWNKYFAIPKEIACAAGIDELNFLAARLETLDPAEVGKLNAAAQRPTGFENIGQMIDFTYNADYFVHIPEVHTEQELGDYYLNKSGMVQMPEEWKAGINLADFGKNTAAQEKGSFTEYGYIVESGDEWERHFEGREVPEEYRIMSYPQPEQPDPEKADFDAIGTAQAATMTTEPPEPRPVIPIVLTSEKPAEKMKEITDRLEKGITEIFNSERYKEYLSVMSKFHDYSLNNTLLIAMQKPDASHVAGFSSWKNIFQRNVKKGEKGIKIIAPSPFKVKQEKEKIDPQTQKPVIGKDGKPVVEETEITIPAYKVVSVFDVSQTEGKELPNISVETLTADVEQYEDFFAALEKTSPVPIAFEEITSGANGYYHLEDKRIAIKEGVSELQAVKTAIHEIAHAKLHDIDLNAPKDEQQPRVDRRTREVEAESVAYTVCQRFGLDTSDYSFGYVAGWSSGKELPELKASLETIQQTAKELISEIEGHFTELQKQRETEKEAAAPEVGGDTFSIYQLKGGDETRDLRFEPYDRLHAAGKAVDPANYDLIYSAPLTQEMTLERIWQTFNIERPADFKGHSLSVSDVVVLHQNGEDAAHYVDSVGYMEVPEFLRKQQKELAPDDYLTDEKIQTPRGTFRLTYLSVEQMKEAGYSFHHQSNDGKHYIMTSNNVAFAVAVEQSEKVNPLKHIEDTVEQNDNSFDGIINNTPQTPTVAELEQKAKSGEPISVIDLANAVKAERRGQPPKKRSILKQLDEYKKQAAQQPQKQQQKNLKQDREV